MARPSRDSVRFVLPPSVGQEAAGARAQQLQSYLNRALGKHTEVVVATSYESLAKDLLSGKVDAAWAPPFVCARIEAMGIRVLVRGVRNGMSTYRGALVCRASAPLTLDTLQGKVAAWSDRDSVGGYLLAIAHLKGKGLEPSKLFAQQRFSGSYRAALDEVLAGKADVTSVFAPPDAETTGLDELVPGRVNELKVIAFTEESPNDGVAVSMNASTTLVTELERTLLGLHSVPEGLQILRDTFHAERFEVAQRMGYRALYRVALASL